MGKFIDLTGQKFNRLTVEEFVGKNRNNSRLWECKCECGGEVVTTTARLRSGKCKSCGCLSREKSTERLTTHNKTNSRLHRIWSNMKTRCYNKNNVNYKRWGAKGVTVCDEWRNDFQIFYDWAMANGYADNLSIDRIDNSKGYCPENCRWANPREQANNTRKVRFIEYNGETHSLHEWSRILGIKVETLFYRLKHLSPEEAFTLPKQVLPGQPLKQAV